MIRLSAFFVFKWVNWWRSLKTLSDNEELQMIILMHSNKVREQYFLCVSHPSSYTHRYCIVIYLLSGVLNLYLKEGREVNNNDVTWQFTKSQWVVNYSNEIWLLYWCCSRMSCICWAKHSCNQYSTREMKLHCQHFSSLIIVYIIQLRYWVHFLM